MSFTRLGIPWGQELLLITWSPASPESTSGRYSVFVDFKMQDYRLPPRASALEANPSLWKTGHTEVCRKMLSSLGQDSAINQATNPELMMIVAGFTQKRKNWQQWLAILSWFYMKRLPTDSPTRIIAMRKSYSYLDSWLSAGPLPSHPYHISLSPYRLSAPSDHLYLPPLLHVETPPNLNDLWIASFNPNWLLHSHKAHTQLQALTLPFVAPEETPPKG